MMRTKFFLMVLAAIVMGSQVTLFAQEKKEKLNLKEGSLIKNRCWKYSAIKL